MYHCVVGEPDPLLESGPLHGLVLWHLSAYPEEMEVLSAPFCILHSTEQTFAGSRLSVAVKYSGCLLHAAKYGDFLEWILRMRRAADALLCDGSDGGTARDADVPAAGAVPSYSSPHWSAGTFHYYS